MRFAYIVLAGLVGLTAFMGNYLFGSYAHSAIDLMARGAKKEGASEEVMNRIGMHSESLTSLINLLSGTLVVVAAFGVISFLVNFHLSGRLSLEQSDNRRLKDASMATSDSNVEPTTTDTEQDEDADADAE